jgi:glycosyltransferase involved in cell wall biosynthesis
MIVIPILLVKNEEVWIERVLTPFANIFPHVIVSDTGSTDSTIKQIEKVKNIHLMTYGNLSPEEVGLCRGWMQAEAQEKFGATHVFMVDGDELYPTKYVKFLHDNPMPEDAMGGFTYGVECTEFENGECWLYGVGVSRHAVFSVDSKWRGTYPFESPDTFIAGHPTNYYWQSLDPSYHFYHVHQMRRSSRDEDVYLRKQKQFQFSMQDHPEIRPVSLWLKHESEYQDE